MYSVGIEIMQGLSSSLGVIMAVPVTSGSQHFYIVRIKNNKEKAEK